ncbi:MAG: DUF2891 domain-containing protein [Phaeodactylibacter sp.]|nr:DUF2891 domain-containing protein [Phaeodactylibacter sp.]
MKTYANLNRILAFPLVLFLFFFSTIPTMRAQDTSPRLTLAEANRLAQLPLKCMQKEYPNKPGEVLAGPEEVVAPKAMHPAFYGCFDWHSAVHGHWMLVNLLKQFPELEETQIIRQKLRENISAENILAELAYFERPHNRSFERTYGWAWLLKLAEELHTWDDPLARELEQNLQPLTDKIVALYLEFLPKLNYPIRVGEHTNTAFGLAFAWDYAHAAGAEPLQQLIEARARDFYLDDQGCPLSWEPSGYDFLSPCLEEADIMRRVLPQAEFKAWLQAFLPALADPAFSLPPGRVSDRTDGKLVHLDGLNFSRAWCFYGIARSLPAYGHLKAVADAHLRYSLPGIVDGGYEGEHWLASFSIYALNLAKP